MKSEFHIRGMRRESCAVEIKETPETTAGVSSAEVTFNGKTASVGYDDAVGQRETIIKKVQDLGYQATVADEPQTQGRGA